MQKVRNIFKIPKHLWIQFQYVHSDKTVIAADYKIQLLLFLQVRLNKQVSDIFEEIIISYKHVVNAFQKTKLKFIAITQNIYLCSQFSIFWWLNITLTFMAHTGAPLAQWSVPLPW